MKRSTKRKLASLVCAVLLIVSMPANVWAIGEVAEGEDIHESDYIPISPMYTCANCWVGEVVPKCTLAPYYIGGMLSEEGNATHGLLWWKEECYMYVFVAYGRDTCTVCGKVWSSFTHLCYEVHMDCGQGKVIRCACLYPPGDPHV